MLVCDKTSKLGPSPGATSAELLERDDMLLVHCLFLLNEIHGPHFYGMIGSAIIPGSLSHLLCVTDDQL